jgi:hypothetical protein
MRNGNIQRDLAELIRIEATRSGRFNPVFKEAPHAAERAFEGIASREGGSVRLTPG